MRIKRKEKTQEQKEKDREEGARMWFFFSLLWSKLPKDKFCSSCGTPIWGENKSYYWDHLLEWKKDEYAHLKYEEENMYFCCGDCHTKKTNGFPTPKHKEAIEEAKKKLL